MTDCSTRPLDYDNVVLPGIDINFENPRQRRQNADTQNWNGLQQINPEATSNHFGLEAALFQPERDLSKNVTIGI